MTEDKHTYTQNDDDKWKVSFSFFIPRALFV